jgi:glucose-6-phosphate isomerase
MPTAATNANTTSTAAGSGATASQAWAILKRHARDEITHLRLLELCRDNDRVSSLVTVYNSLDNQHMMMVDLSRQKLTLETLNHLLRLARARNIKDFITRLAWGPGNDPSQPILPKRVRTHASKKYTDEAEADQGAGGIPSLSSSSTSSSTSVRIPSYHLCLRAPRGSEMLLQDGANATTEVHSEWDRIQRVSESLRRGKLPGVTGQMIRDVVVVGQGVSIMALRFVYLALCQDEQATIGRRSGMTDARRVQAAGQRRIKFVTSVDPVRVAGVVADLDAATTLVITIALTGKEETMAATGLLQSWLFQSLGVLQGRRPAEQVLSKHMVFITGNERLGMQRKPETIFLLPDHSRSEPFSTFTATTLFPLAFAFGWSIVEHFLQGGHDMDSHFVETNPRHNLPVLLALCDVWNEAFLQSNGRVVTPFTDAFAAYPAFCAALESQTCGNATGAAMAGVSSGSQVLVDGGLHHAYDRSLYQSSKLQPTELVMMLDSQIASNAAGLHADMEEIHAAQDDLLCSLFAHADELAFGSSTTDGKGAVGFLSPNLTTTAATTTTTTSNGTIPAASSLNTLENTSEGNRPSVLVLCGRLDAFSCGQFVALAEHRSVIKARLWDMDPFVHETGSTLRASRMVSLKETLKTMFVSDGGEDDDDDEDGADTNLSTRTILRHYSNLMRDQRVYTVNNG